MVSQNSFGTVLRYLFRMALWHQLPLLPSHCLLRDRRQRLTLIQPNTHLSQHFRVTVGGTAEVGNGGAECVRILLSVVLSGAGAARRQTTAVASQRQHPHLQLLLRLQCP